LPAPYERSKVTCEWLAWLVYSKFVLLMPPDRIRRDLAERGVRMAMGTLVSLVERAPDILGPVERAGALCAATETASFRSNPWQRLHAAG
jgi:hypothetical protein